MLYDRWREVARAHALELALKDLSDGRSWTFAQLFEAADRATDPGEVFVCPRGSGSEFVFEVLRAWKWNRVTCPLEETDSVPNVPLPPRDLVHLKRTSATTGSARYVAFTAQQLAADCANICSTMGLRAEWPNVAAISLAHSYGFSNLILPLLLEGLPLLLLRSPLPEALRKVCAAGGEYTLASVPALWRAWHEIGAIAPNVRLAISAGAPLPLPLETEIFQRTGVKLHNFMGASECGGIAYDRTSNPRADAAMVGTAMNNVQLAIADGLLEVRGPAVASSYWPELRAELSGGVFRTTDLAELRDGQLFMRGRASDVIHLAGRKVPPEDIERALSAHPAVKECLVFGAPRGNDENQIVAIVVGDPTTQSDLKNFLAERLPAWQLPRQWQFVDSLGANGRGKVSRAQWRERFIAQQA